MAYIRKSYPYVPPWIWNSRINHHKLSVTKNRQNQQNSEVSPMFFCFPYYFTWASSVQDSCCFHVGSPFSAIVWFSLRSISLFFADREWNHRIQRPGDGGMCGKRRHISIGYNRYMPARDYMKSLSGEGTSSKMRAMSFGIKSCGRRLNVSPLSSRSCIVVCNCVFSSLLKIFTSLSFR